MQQEPTNSRSSATSFSTYQSNAHSRLQEADKLPSFQMHQFYINRQLIEDNHPHNPPPFRNCNPTAPRTHNRVTFDDSLNAYAAVFEDEAGDGEAESPPESPTTTRRQSFNDLGRILDDLRLRPSTGNQRRDSNQRRTFGSMLTRTATATSQASRRFSASSSVSEEDSASTRTVRRTLTNRSAGTNPAYYADFETERESILKNLGLLQNIGNTLLKMQIYVVDHDDSVYGVKEYNLGDLVSGFLLVTNNSKEDIPFEMVSISLKGTTNVVKKLGEKTTLEFLNMVDLESCLLREDCETRYNAKTGKLVNLGLPADRIFRANQVYKLQFLFTIPSRLLDVVCGKQMTKHLMLPPSFGISGLMSAFMGGTPTSGFTIRDLSSVAYGYNEGKHFIDESDLLALDEDPQLLRGGDGILVNDVTSSSYSISYSLECVIIGKDDKADAEMERNTNVNSLSVNSEGARDPPSMRAYNDGWSQLQNRVDSAPDSHSIQAMLLYDETHQVPLPTVSKERSNFVILNTATFLLRVVPRDSGPSAKREQDPLVEARNRAFGQFHGLENLRVLFERELNRIECIVEEERMRFAGLGRELSLLALPASAANSANSALQRAASGVIRQRTGGSLTSNLMRVRSNQSRKARRDSDKETGDKIKEKHLVRTRQQLQSAETEPASITNPFEGYLEDEDKTELKEESGSRLVTAVEFERNGRVFGALKLASPDEPFTLAYYTAIGLIRDRNHKTVWQMLSDIRKRKRGDSTASINAERQHHTLDLNVEFRSLLSDQRNNDVLQTPPSITVDSVDLMSITVDSQYPLPIDLEHANFCYGTAETIYLNDPSKSPESSLSAIVKGNELVREFGNYRERFSAAKAQADELKARLKEAFAADSQELARRSERLRLSVPLIKNLNSMLSIRIKKLIVADPLTVLATNLTADRWDTRINYKSNEVVQRNVVRLSLKSPFNPDKVKETLVPSFQSCLISRLYCLRIDLGLELGTSKRRAIVYVPVEIR